ncbi:MAG: redoxin domain-containing protein [Acidobacteria bacterium]|nr:redoxin domain-containing protein [Acidobacteriota bacterium]
MRKIIALLSLFALLLGASPAAAETPAVGDKAPDFTLRSLDGRQVSLSTVNAAGPLALVMLRGYPGYQCPVCNRQVNDFLQNAVGFDKAGAQVIFVYPGPSEQLQARAEEFTADKTLPTGFHFLLDPGYEFTNLYGLRWDAPRETAYPATFLLDKAGKIVFAKISDSHGGRTAAAEMVAKLAALR